jgi:hypothetical protein
VPGLPWTAPLVALSYSIEFRSAVKEVTGVASNAFAPATLAGRGVIKLIGADAGIFPRGPNFMLPKSGVSRPFGKAIGSSNLRPP